MLDSIRKVVKKVEIPIVLLVFAILILGYIQGSEWSWNPDEIVKRVNWSLTGNYNFANDFLYPTLPLYVMYAVGKWIYSLGLAEGYRQTLFFSVCRWISAFLGAASVLLIYATARRLRPSGLLGLGALLLAAASPMLAVNAHYAHNDIYQFFFCCAALYFLVRYLLGESQRWFYLGVFAIGLAASCKYTAGILLPGALLAFALVERGWKRLLTGFGGAILVCYLGYALGTPLALLNPLYYFSSLLPALQFQRSFGQLSQTAIGLVGQWQMMARAFTAPMLVFWIAAMLGVLILAWRVWQRQRQPVPGAVFNRSERVAWVCAACIVLLDLPIAQSYNYQERFFLPMLPFLAVLAALLLADALAGLGRRGWFLARAALLLLSAGLVLYSAASVVSITLLFKYEPRIAAGNYLRSQIVAGKTLEYTLYPPVIPQAYFKSAVQYPLFFKKAADWEKTIDSDQGLAGITARSPDVLVVDSFTYTRYDLAEVCQLTPNDCAFFHDLLGDKTNYHLAKSFHYEIPRFLPQVETAFLNPVIAIYERQK
jgi:hypothetical protein